MLDEPVFLDLAQILAIHRYQLQRYGGSQGIREMGLLESALAQPSMGFGEAYLHRTIFDQAAAYLFHLCAGHPFVDGNKRVALHASLVFLRLNGWWMEVEDDKLYSLTMAVAGSKVDKETISEFFQRYSVDTRAERGT